MNVTVSDNMKNRLLLAGDRRARRPGSVSASPVSSSPLDHRSVTGTSGSLTTTYIGQNTHAQYTGARSSSKNNSSSCRAAVSI